VTLRGERERERERERGGRLLSGHINVNFHPGSPRTYLQSKLLATKAAASAVAEGGGGQGERGGPPEGEGEKMPQYALLRYY